MKKFIASAGLVTVGTVSLQAAYAPGLSTMETSKPWSISASLRGFYDDNYNNAPKSLSKASGGFEVSPSARLNFPMEQTYVGFSALYSLKYYFDRPSNQPKDDHLFEFTAKADHRFSERFKASFDDSFVYTVEPTLLDATGAITAPGARQNSDAIRNRAAIKFDGQLTDLLGFGTSYQNTWYDYVKNTALETDLNRTEHLFDLHGTYSLQEHTKALFGYQYGVVGYSSDKLLDPTNPLTSLNGKSRDNSSHYLYLGADHAFSSQLNGTLQVGAQETNQKHPTRSAWSPYADVRGTYTYLPGSYVQLGVTHTRNATDVVGSGTDADLVKDQESTTVFGSINHRITPRLTGNLLGQFQRSVYTGGINIDGKVDYYLLASLNLEYRINNNWSAEVGYNFDHLDSDLGGRSFSRNRVYGGVRASF